MCIWQEQQGQCMFPLNVCMSQQCETGTLWYEKNDDTGDLEQLALLET